MATYEQVVTEERRLNILILLEHSDGYRCNEYLLQAQLEGRGHVTSQDRLRSELSWLQEQGLVRIDETGAVQVATVTGRGVDVARGRTVVPGVKRPRPRSGD